MLLRKGHPIYHQVTLPRLTIENRWTADAKRRILSGCGAADASGVAS